MAPRQAAISQGSVVRLCGLKGAAHLNGFTGTCEEWDGAASRWVVRLQSGERKSLKKSEPCASFEKITKRSGEYRPVGNHAMDLNMFRVLIQKCAAAEDEDLGTPPKKSRRVQDRGFKMCEEAETHHKMMQKLHRSI